MKISGIVIILSLFILTIDAQEGDFAWAKTFGSVDKDYGYLVGTDIEGNLFTAGMFHDSIDFDPGPNVTLLNSNGELDIYISKYNKNGKFQWAKSIGGFSDDICQAIHLDEEGNLYLTGQFKAEVDFDPGSNVTLLKTTSRFDGFLLKLDTDGNFVWVKSVGGMNSYIIPRDIMINAKKEVYLVGVYHGMTDFDPGVNMEISDSDPYGDAFILKLDEKGTFIWVKTINGNQIDHIRSADLDSLGNIYVTGLFLEDLDLDPGKGRKVVRARGSGDAFLIKLNPDGDYLWSKVFTGPSRVYTNEMKILPSGEILILGVYYKNMDADPGPNTRTLIAKGAESAMLIKLSSEGKYIWSKNLTGDGRIFPSHLVIDSNNDFLIAGYFEDNIDFDPGINNHTVKSNDKFNTFFVKFSSEGKYQWVRFLHAPLGAYIYDMCLDPVDNIYITGYFAGQTNFDPNNSNYSVKSNNQSWDIFIAKYLQCIPTFGVDSLIACDSLEWIDGNTYTSSNNTATCTLTNSTGCDSIISLNLTINSLNLTVQLTNKTLSAIEQDASFQWLDCNQQNHFIQGETDSIFIASKNGTYAVEIEKYGCVDTSDCYDIVTVSNISTNNLASINLSPNPTMGDVFVNVKNTSLVNLKIYDIHGKLYKVISSLKSDIETVKLPSHSGLYIIELNSKFNSVRRKIIKL